MDINLKTFIIFCLICLNFGFSKVFAQQTIISVPSSEMLPAGEMVLKDSNRYHPIKDGYASFTPSATVGVGHGIELFSGVGTSISEGTVVRSDVGAKKVWFLGNSTRLTTGGVVSPYLNQSAQPDTFIYAHLSQRIKKTRTTLTAGAYLDGRKSFPDSTGVLLGVEQVIIPNKLRFVMDWLSTPDSYGRMGVGFKYRPVSTVSITTALIVPNEDSENIGFNVSISKFIDLKDTKIGSIFEKNQQKRRL